MEWLRVNYPCKKGELFLDDSLRYIIMDVTMVPNYDKQGQYLLMLMPVGEVTKASSTKEEA